LDELEEDYEEPVEPWIRRWATPLSIASIPVMLLIFRAIFHTLHLHFEDALRYPRFTDDGVEVNSEISFAGWYAIIITLMMARRLYWICKASGLKYHIDREATLLWNTWFIALTVETVFIYSFDAAVPAFMPARGVIFPAITATVAWICYRVYKAILRAPEPK
jgi:hypothetical protein